jgi:hypothetical protein
MACVLLHRIKVPGKNTPHHYPTIQLSYLLLLQHWKVNSHCSYEMMKHNMSVYNEELGEIGFSILSSTVLGDHNKDDFDHMNRMYRLIPVLRDIKREVMQDHSLPTSLSWRHKINIQGDEVTTAGVFFRQVIRRIVGNTFQSYGSSVEAYSNSASAAMHLTRASTPDIRMTKEQFSLHLNRLITVIRTDLYGFFVYRIARDLWPDAAESWDMSQDDEYPGSHEDSEPETADVFEVADQDVSFSDDDLKEMALRNQDPEQPEAHLPDSDVPISPYEQRSWRAWGAVSPENQMVGPRRRAPPERLMPSKRRVVYTD